MTPAVTQLVPQPGATCGGAMTTDVRQLEALTREESLRLLGSTSLGRVVFTHFALPAIRPVDASEIARDQRALRPWVSGNMDEVIAITADIVDGFRLTRSAG